MPVKTGRASDACCNTTLWPQYKSEAEDTHSVAAICGQALGETASVISLEGSDTNCSEVAVTGTQTKTDHKCPGDFAVMALFGLGNKKNKSVGSLLDCESGVQPVYAKF